MGEIKEVEEKKEEPKMLEDIVKRYLESQKELMDVMVTLFVKMDVAEKKLASPLLNKLLD